MEISLIPILLIFFQIVSANSQEGETIYVLSDLENHIKKQFQQVAHNDDFSMNFHRNNDDVSEEYILDNSNNLPVLNITVQTVLHNSSELIKIPEEKGGNIDRFSFINREILSIKYNNDTIRFDKELFDVTIQGEILFTHKSLIFTSNKDEIHLYRYFNNFIVEKDVKDLNIQLLNNCSLDGKLFNSGNFILSFHDYLCFFILEESDNYPHYIILKNIIGLPNQFHNKNLISFFTFTDTVLLVFESSFLLVDFQSNILAEIKSFSSMSESFNLHITQAHLVNERLYVLSVSFGMLVYSINKTNSIKLLTKLRHPSIRSFNIEGDKINFVNKGKRSQQSTLEIYTININQTSFDYKTKINIEDPTNDHVLNFEGKLFKYEGFNVIFSKSYKKLQFLDINDTERKSNAVLIEKLRLNEDEDSFIDDVFILETENEKRMGIVLNNKKVLMIKNLKSGERKLDFTFLEYGVYEFKIKAMVETMREGEKSLYISTKVNVSNLNKLSNIYNESYIYTAFYIMIGILLIGILMVITSSIYNYFENRNQRNIKAGYALTTSKDKTVNNQNEEEKFTLDIELEIKSN